MIRNEILESGQVVALYSNGFWEGQIRGYATLDKLSNDLSPAISETWMIILPDGQRRHWTMINPDKTVTYDDVYD